MKKEIFLTGMLFLLQLFVFVILMIHFGDVNYVISAVMGYIVGNTIKKMLVFVKKYQHELREEICNG